MCSHGRCVHKPVQAILFLPRSGKRCVNCSIRSPVVLQRRAEFLADYSEAEGILYCTSTRRRKDDEETIDASVRIRHALSVDGALAEQRQLRCRCQSYSVYA